MPPRNSYRRSLARLVTLVTLIFLFAACGETESAVTNRPDSDVGGDVELDSGVDTGPVTPQCDVPNTLCGEDCVDLDASPQHCGACGTSCGAGEVCSGGTCAPHCPGGQEVCGGGCFDLSNTPTHCGGCDNSCDEGDVCSNGQCQLSCGGGLDECGGICRDTLTDRNNCGNCSNACDDGEVCSGGTCQVSCGGGLDDCGGICRDTQTDRDHCGTCELACGAGEVCSGGTCQVSCGGGLDECGGICRDTLTDRNNCGSCDVACGAGEVCSGGTCQVSCGGGLDECNGVCRDTQTDRNNCGTCGTACGAGEVCSGGTCEVSCGGGLDQCGGVCRDTLTDRNHCGACGVACGAGEVCSAGTCQVSCGGGLEDCDGVCRDTLTDRNNCGTCGDVCEDGEVCSNGGCQLSCGGGLEDCEGVCRDTQVDRNNCGACGNSCADGEVCSGGACQLSCGGGLEACGGVCRHLQSDPNHCGACDNACLPGYACAQAECSPLTDFPSRVSGLRMWLRADRGMTLDGDRIVGWANQVNPSQIVAQNDVSAAPKYAGNTFLGQPAARFDGSSFMTNGDFAYPRNTLTHIMVFAPAEKIDATTSGRRDLFYGHPDSAARPHITLNREGDGRIGKYVRVEDESYDEVKSAQDVWYPGVPYVVTFTFDGTDFRVYVDGELEHTENLPGAQGELFGFYLGVVYSEAVGFFSGDIAEMLIYDEVLSTQDQRGVEIHLADKFGLYHPEASWIGAYPADVQSEIHAYGLKKNAVDTGSFQTVPTEASCLAHREAGRLLDGVYRIHGGMPNVPFDAYCDMTTDGGGWTLVMVKANDGVSTFTWNQRSLLWDTRTVGDVYNRAADFKSRAYANITFTDMYFWSANGTTAGYNAVAGTNGNQTVADFIVAMNYDAVGCKLNPNRPGTPLSFGNMVAALEYGTYRVVDTDLYFSMHDQEGGMQNCPVPLGGWNDNSFGPTWDVMLNWNCGDDSCAFDDNVFASFTGITAATNGYYSYDLEVPTQIFSGEFTLAGHPHATGPNIWTEIYHHWYVR